MTLLVGCAVGPDFTRPAAPDVDRITSEALPAKTEATDVAGGQSQSLIAGDDIPGQWWTLFHSAPLNALIDEALRTNPDLAAAQAALRQASESVVVQQGSFLPTGGLSSSVTRERQSGASFGLPGFQSQYTLYNASVNISYVPDVFGGTRRAVESAEAQADYTRFQLEAAYLSLTANLVTAAIQEASLRGQVAATEEILTEERKQLEVVRNQFDLGAASKADVLEQEATLHQTEATLPPLQKQLAQAEIQRTVYAGRLPSQNDGQVFTLDSLRLPDTLPISLPSKLVEQRPDIREAEAQLHDASAKVGVAVANMLPQLKLTGSYGGSALNLGDLFQPGNIVWNIAANASEPLFDQFTLQHEKRAAEAAFDQAAAQYRSTVLKSFQDVANALHAIEYDAVTLKAELAAEKSAADSLAIAQSQYQLGAINYLTLLNAEKTDQQTRISLVQAQAARYADTAALFQALGGGWWNRADVAPETTDVHGF